jgi:Ca2+:H+ antiporter
MLSQRDTQSSYQEPHRQRQRQHAQEMSWNRVQAWITTPAQGFNIGSSLSVMILLPLAGAAKLFHWNATIILVVNIIAIFFLSEAITNSADKLAEHMGELQGALLSATFGNTVELTVSLNLLLSWTIALAQS